MRSTPMFQRAAVALSAAAALALPTSTLALDVPEGGDALGHQLRGSQAVAFAELADTGGTLAFRRAQALVGRVPDGFQVPADEYVRAAGLKSGNFYVVFLNSALRGRWALSMSRYSLVLAGANDVGAYRDAIRMYQGAGLDRAAFRKAALALLDSRVEHLQYSGMSDLARRGLFTANDAPRIARVALDMRAPPEARKIALRQLGRLGAKAHAETMGDVLGDPAEPVSVRMAALDGLDTMGETQVIAKHSEAVSAERSPKLKARTFEAARRRP